MKKFILTLCILLTNVSVSLAVPVIPSVCFTPGGQCTERIVSAIASAKKSVWVQAYSFTSTPIVKALIDAHQRKLDVRVVLDVSNQTAQYTAATFLMNAGVPVLIDKNHAIAHNKIMIIDGKSVFTGSFNFTQAAQERNAENSLLVRGSVVADYIKNFTVHESHAVKYERK